jgi:hypothetical protein
MNAGASCFTEGPCCTSSPQASIRAVPALPKVRIFMAAFISRSCSSLHSGQIQDLSESREVCPFIEEIVICSIQIPKGRLQRLGINSVEPFKFGIFLHLCQGSRCIVVIQTFLLATFIFRIVVNSLTQKVVIDETDTAKVLLKHFSLLSIGIYSEFECLVYYHAQNCRRVAVDCQVCYYYASKEEAIHLPDRSGSLPMYNFIEVQPYWEG